MTITSHSTTDASPEAPASDPQVAVPDRRDAIERVLIAALLLAAALAFSALWWPGHMSADFLTMYGLSLQDRATDWHSPAFILLMSALRPLGAGPGWVLVAQIGGLLLGFFLLLRTRFRRPPAAAIAIGLMATPMVLGMAGSLSRDVWFAQGLILTFGFAATLARHQGTWTRRMLLACGLLSILLMILARQNGLVAAPPAAMALLVAWKPSALSGKRKVARAFVLSGFAALATLLLAQTAMYQIADVEKTHPEAALYLYDVTAIAQLGADVELPPTIRTKPMDEVVARFVRPSMASLVWVPDPPTRFPSSPEQVDDLSASWRSAVLNHPLTWGRARLRLWLDTAAVSDRSIFIYHPTIDPNTLGLATRFPKLEKQANAYIRAFALPDLRGSVLFDVWIYLVIAAIAIPKFWRRGGPWRIPALLGVSSLMCQISLFLMTPTAEYRFQYASVTAGIVLLVLMVGRPQPRTATAPRQTASQSS